MTLHQIHNSESTVPTNRFFFRVNNEPHMNKKSKKSDLGFLNGSRAFYDRWANRFSFIAASKEEFGKWL